MQVKYYICLYELEIWQLTGHFQDYVEILWMAARIVFGIYRQEVVIREPVIQGTWVVDKVVLQPNVEIVETNVVVLPMMKTLF